jgi:transposase
MRLGKLNRHTRDEYLKRAKALFEQGLSKTAVSKRLNIGASTAQNMKKELGLVDQKNFKRSQSVSELNQPEATLMAEASFLQEDKCL